MEFKSAICPHTWRIHMCILLVWCLGLDTNFIHLFFYRNILSWIFLCKHLLRVHYSGSQWFLPPQEQRSEEKWGEQTVWRLPLGFHIPHCEVMIDDKVRAREEGCNRIWRISPRRPLYEDLKADWGILIPLQFKAPQRNIIIDSAATLPSLLGHEESMGQAEVWLDKILLSL